MLSEKVLQDAGNRLVASYAKAGGEKLELIDPAIAGVLVNVALDLIRGCFASKPAAQSLKKAAAGIGPLQRLFLVRKTRKALQSQPQAIAGRAEAVKVLQASLDTLAKTPEILVEELLADEYS